MEPFENSLETHSTQSLIETFGSGGTGLKSWSFLQKKISESHHAYYTDLQFSMFHCRISILLK